MKYINNYLFVSFLCETISTQLPITFKEYCIRYLFIYINLLEVDIGQPNIRPNIRIFMSYIISPSH